MEDEASEITQNPRLTFPQLFKGLPTLPKLALWDDTATFSDPITKAEGRAQYAAQWYGLKAAFSSITQLSQSVTSDKNPITIDLKTKYKLAGVGMEKVMESQVLIWTKPVGGVNGADGEKLRIVKVEDRWNGGELPEGPFAKVRQNGIIRGGIGLMNPFYWAGYVMETNIWVICQIWEMWWWQVSESSLACHSMSPISYIALQRVCL